MLTGYCLVLFRKSPDPFRGLTWQTRILFILAQTPAELLMCCGKAKKKLSIYPNFGSTGQVVCDDLRRWHQNPNTHSCWMLFAWLHRDSKFKIGLQGKPPSQESAYITGPNIYNQVHRVHYGMLAPLD